jgi:hypothetical protein
MDPDRVERSRGSGMASTGKYLGCVYKELDDTIYPITAFDLDDQENPMPRTRKTAVRVNRPLLPLRRQRQLEARAAAERDKDAIIARGRAIMRQRKAATAAIRETFQLLKQERQAQGVTLQELQ